jgi:hypothetical protein
MTHQVLMAESVGQVIELLGGPSVMAALTNRTPQAVSNWKTANRFPAWSYLTLSRKLEEVGWQAPPTLWGIVEPAEAEQ